MRVLIDNQSLDEDICITGKIMNRLKLTLYVSGRTIVAERAIYNLGKICEEHYSNQYELTVVDILENAEFIDHINILATPTLIKESPAPWRRLVGDFSDIERVLYGLGHPDLYR